MTAFAACLPGLSVLLWTMLLRVQQYTFVVSVTRSGCLCGMELPASDLTVLLVAGRD